MSYFDPSQLRSYKWSVPSSIRSFCKRNLLSTKTTPTVIAVCNAVNRRDKYVLMFFRFLTFATKKHQFNQK